MDLGEGDPTSFTNWASSLGTRMHHGGLLKVLLKVGYLFNVDLTLSRHLDSEEDIVLSILTT